MSETDHKLRGNGSPGTVSRRRVNSYITTMYKVIDDHIKAVNLKGGDKTMTSNSKRFESLKSPEIWKQIKEEYDFTKKTFGNRISFVNDSNVRLVIFRDTEHAYILEKYGFNKPATVLAGGVIEELLRQYLIYKGIKPSKDDFNGYIKTCKEKGLIRDGYSGLSDTYRYFRNFVHISKEKTKKHAISKGKAKGAVAAIFTIIDAF